MKTWPQHNTVSFSVEGNWKFFKTTTYLPSQNCLIKSLEGKQIYIFFKCSLVSKCCCSNVVGLTFSSITCFILPYVFPVRNKTCFLKINVFPATAWQKDNFCDTLFAFLIEKGIPNCCPKMVGVTFKFSNKFHFT